MIYLMDLKAPIQKLKLDKSSGKRKESLADRLKFKKRGQSDMLINIEGDAHAE
jgi:hypothetical protein